MCCQVGEAAASPQIPDSDPSLSVMAAADAVLSSVLSVSCFRIFDPPFPRLTMLNHGFFPPLLKAVQLTASENQQAAGKKALCYEGFTF